MAKVTYLLGAGASIGSFPVVEGMAKAIEEIANRIKDIISVSETQYYLKEDKIALYKTVYEDLNKLHKGCLNHVSIDTYAKKLFLTTGKDKTLYREAKAAIVLFFELYRYYNQHKKDKRYDAFLAALLNEDREMPDHINVISWNYDYEFELAYLNYTPDFGPLSKTSIGLNVTYKNGRHGYGPKNRFGIVKVNGVVGFHDKDGRQDLGLGHPDTFSVGDMREEPANLLPIIENYINDAYKKKREPSISFAWEKDYGERKIKDEIALALEGTGTLIVIGYSFPYFNREIDKWIFENLTYGGARVFVQDPNATDIVEDIVGVDPRDPLIIRPYTPLKSTKQFHIV